jgi:hypothetical protein
MLEVKNSVCGVTCDWYLSQYFVLQYGNTPLHFVFDGREELGTERGNLALTQCLVDRLPSMALEKNLIGEFGRWCLLSHDLCCTSLIHGASHIITGLAEQTPRGGRGYSWMYWQNIERASVQACSELLKRVEASLAYPWWPNDLHMVFSDHLKKTIVTFRVATWYLAHLTEYVDALHAERSLSWLVVSYVMPHIGLGWMAPGWLPESRPFAVEDVSDAVSDVSAAAKRDRDEA